MHGRPPARDRTIAKIQIDQRLIRNVELAGEAFEILYRRRIEAHRHRLFQALSVGISLGLRKIVFFSHNFNRASYWARSDLVARRAEISRIVFLLSRSQ